MIVSKKRTNRAQILKIDGTYRRIDEFEAIMGCKGSLVRIQSPRPFFLKDFEPQAKSAKNPLKFHLKLNKGISCVFRKFWPQKGHKISPTAYSLFRGEWPAKDWLAFTHSRQSKFKNQDVSQMRPELVRVSNVSGIPIPF